MSLLASFPTAILDTILGRLALLFIKGAAGDLAAARCAAAKMLAAYRPETLDELHLAAEIVSFGMHALDALGQSAEPDTPPAKVLRLRGGAVSLSRESHKAQRRLDQLQNARRKVTAAQPTETTATPAEPAPAGFAAANASQPVEASSETPAAITPRDAKTWTQRYQQRLAARRITENLRKHQPTAAAPRAVPADAQIATTPE